MGYLVLCAIAIIICAAINIYDAKQYKERKYYESITKSNTNDKYDVKKTIEQPKKNSTVQNTINKSNTIMINKEWITIDKHGFSFNKMYKPNPKYNPIDPKSLPLKKTVDYNLWITETLKLMETSNIPSFEDMSVDPNKPMKIEVEFKLVAGSDTDNPIKAFLDIVQRYYNLKDDNNFYVVNISRDFECAKGEKDGQIKFRITNIERNRITGELTEIKIIKVKDPSPVIVSNATPVIDFEKRISDLTIEVQRKDNYIKSQNKKFLELKEQMKQQKTAEIIKEVPVIKEVIKEVPKIITKEVVKKVEVTKEYDYYKKQYESYKLLYETKLDNEDNYKLLYESYKKLYETEKEENNKLKENKPNKQSIKNREYTPTSKQNNKSDKIVKTATYERQLNKIRQMQ